MAGRNKGIESLTFNGDKVNSYETHVATIQGDDLLIYGKYSATTSRHLNNLAEMRGLNKVMLEKGDKPNEPEVSGEQTEVNPFKMVGMVSALGNVLCDTLEERNKWKLRMIKAGITGIIFPDDWDSLPEQEKEIRLDKIIDLCKSPE